jgi:hypothetical protein
LPGREERRPHLSGAWRWPVIVLKLGRDKRIAGTRAVAITKKGRQGVQHAFGFRLEY